MLKQLQKTDHSPASRRQAPGETEAEVARAAFMEGAAGPTGIASRVLDADIATRARMINRLQRDRGNIFVQRMLVQARQPRICVSIQRSPGLREELQKEYKVQIEKGDKDWSAADIQELQGVLKRLTPKELQVLIGYKFIRWSTKDARARIDKSYSEQGGEEECGLHESTEDSSTLKISMYDKCFKSAEAKLETMAGLPIGQFHMLHEIGHAMEVAQLRALRTAYDQANRQYNAAIAKYNAASTEERPKLAPQIQQLDQAEKIAEQKYEGGRGQVIDTFQKLIKGKKSLTQYSNKSTKEAFSEAFTIFKAGPKGLKKKNLKLYNWFTRHGYL